MPPSVTTRALPAESTPSVRALGTGAVVLLLVVVLAAATAASLAVGTRSISPGEVARVLLHPDGSEASAVVRGLRVPRTLLALLVGGALGVAGGLLQSLTRNPLADPGFLGVNAGAALAVALGVTAGLTSLDAYVWLALLGAGVATTAVHVLGSRGRSGGGPVTLALTGAAVAAACTGLTTALVLRSSQSVDSLRLWQTGSVAGRDGSVTLTVLPFVLLGAALAAGVQRGLSRLALGEDVARSLGVHVRRTRAVTLLAATLLAGAATAAAGPIVFVGLVAPHVARRLAGLHSGALLPLSAVVGAGLLVVADVLGRVVARPGEVQVSIVTALVGAPFFVALVRRPRLASL
ncbi:iron complex transport system permease protein [Motilibacter peucedani]|uniref:Iron complex transport system permease protein n=1 Tax=Motilibacter peucedani TaxID=598650 RepID=A0A420XUL2_9ACTN|nr:iron ABC transporter permease [Motilibacter peucedani]RKS80526.1 iron complex transport system permease protein [Motilibacter peucedani]